MIIRAKYVTCSLLVNIIWTVSTITLLFGSRWQLSIMEDKINCLFQARISINKDPDDWNAANGVSIVWFEHNCQDIKGYIPWRCSLSPYYHGLQHSFLCYTLYWCHYHRRLSGSSFPGGRNFNEGGRNISVQTLCVSIIFIIPCTNYQFVCSYSLLARAAFCPPAKLKT